MLEMQQYLSTAPFDVYELFLFQLVAKHRSFTKAAAAAGLTQSAITRQIQGMETSLGVTLLERTTRSVSLTSAGHFLNQESARLVGDVERLYGRLREEFAGAKKQVRVGVSRTIALSYLPGFFHANLRRFPDLVARVEYRASQEIFSALEAHELDIGVCCAPQRLPPSLQVRHSFEDAFTLVAPTELSMAFEAAAKSKRQLHAWLGKQNWLLIDENTSTGQQLRRWMTKQQLRVEPVMQLDNFDLLINLVALGMGISFVPIRALANYNRKRRLIRLKLPNRFSRDLVVVVRKHRKMPEHITSFVNNVLF